MTTPSYCRDCGTPLTDGNRSTRTKSRCDNCERILWEQKNRQRGHSPRASRARLTKAAPDLLAALERITCQALRGDYVSSAYIIDQAREALNKAKGGS